MSVSAETLRAGLAEPLTELGVDLETIDVQKAGRRHVVRVVVDRDGGVDLDLIASVSQRISALLDEPPLSESMPGPFVLEVTSPGTDRPLTEPRHWRRAVSRLVHATLADGTVIEGRIIEVPSDAEVVIATPSGDVVVPLSQVRRAVVQIEFNRADAPADADADADAVVGDEEE
jgi:ribosome maturation factor RimP